MHTNAEVDLVVKIKLLITSVRMCFQSSSISCARQGVPGWAPEKRSRDGRREHRTQGLQLLRTAVGNTVLCCPSVGSLGVGLETGLSHDSGDTSLERLKVCTNDCARSLTPSEKMSQHQEIGELDCGKMGNHQPLLLQHSAFLTPISAPHRTPPCSPVPSSHGLPCMCLFPSPTVWGRGRSGDRRGQSAVELCPFPACSCCPAEAQGQAPPNCVWGPVG